MTPVGSRAGAVVRQLGAFVVAVAVAVLGFLLLLGWHEPYDREPGSTTETGPYEPWQVACLVVILLVVVVVGTWIGAAGATVTGIAAGITAIVIADWSTAPSEDASLWLIGAALVAFCAVGGGTLVAAAASLVLPRRREADPVR